MLPTWWKVTCPKHAAWLTWYSAKYLCRIDQGTGENKKVEREEERESIGKIDEERERKGVIEKEDK